MSREKGIGSVQHLLCGALFAPPASNRNPRIVCWHRKGGLLLDADVAPLGGVDDDLVQRFERFRA
jgi:hypothetical protein